MPEECTDNQGYHLGRQLAVILACFRLQPAELCITTRKVVDQQVERRSLTRNSLRTNSFAQTLVASIDPGIGILDIGHYEIV